MRKLLIWISLLAGCAQSPFVVGPVREPLASNDVVIYYIDRPPCNFETIAHLRTDGGYLSLNSMVEKLRQQAAEIGASGLYVYHTQQSELKEFSGSAKAIRCRAS